MYTILRCPISCPSAFTELNNTMHAASSAAGLSTDAPCHPMRDDVKSAHRVKRVLPKEEYARPAHTSICSHSARTRALGHAGECARSRVGIAKCLSAVCKAKFETFPVLRSLPVLQSLGNTLCIRGTALSLSLSPRTYRANYLTFAYVINSSQTKRI